jgi:hypothetical protein
MPRLSKPELIVQCAMQVTRKLLIACSLSAGFMVVEVIGGFYAGRCATHRTLDCTEHSLLPPTLAGRSPKIAVPLWFWSTMSAPSPARQRLADQLASIANSSAPCNPAAGVALASAQHKEHTHGARRRACSVAIMA